MEFTLPRIIALLCLGLTTGMLGGLLGVGGGTIFIPGMRLLGISQHLAQAAAMIPQFFIAVPASVRHSHYRVVLGPVVRVMIPAAAVATVAGVLVSNLPLFRGSGTVYLARIFAAFLAYVVVYNLWRLIQFRRRLAEVDDAAARRLPRWRSATVGLMSGFASGLLGIGGGVLAVPAQQVLLRLPLRNAIGNSACMMVVSTLIGATLKNSTLSLHGHALSSSLAISAMLIPCSFVGSWIGANLTHKLPRHPVRAVFVVAMALAAWKMWQKGAAVPLSDPPDHRPPPATAPHDP